MSCSAPSNRTSSLPGSTTGQRARRTQVISPFARRTPASRPRTALPRAMAARTWACSVSSDRSSTRLRPIRTSGLLASRMRASASLAAASRPSARAVNVPSDSSSVNRWKSASRSLDERDSALRSIARRTAVGSSRYPALPLTTYADRPWRSPCATIVSLPADAKKTTGQSGARLRTVSNTCSPSPQSRRYSVTTTAKPPRDRRSARTMPSPTSS